ncbi:IS3 family transposase, partial [Metabacillus litoralis]|uniref:IS3 family transposase n=1 Tax=Metabacillus litoralis TaxID=152268 RepID=UPI001CFDD463
KKRPSLDELLSIADWWISKGFFVKRIIGILELNRSTYYDRKSEKKIKVHPKRGRPVPGYSLHKDGHIIPDEQIEEHLMEYDLDDEIGGLGYKKWRSLLIDDHDLIISKKKVYRLCKELDILKECRKKQTKHPRSIARNRTITAPNQLWQLDIKYGSITGTSYFVFMCCAIDVYDRQIVGIYRGSTCRAKDITTMLTKALIRRKIHFKAGEFEEKLIVRTDNGPQFVSHLFGDFCQYQKIHHERIPNKTPNMNAYIESFHSQIQRECFDRHHFHFYDEAYYYIDRYIDFYNTVRPHGSLKNRSPEKFSQLSLAGEIPIQEVSL